MEQIFIIVLVCFLGIYLVSKFIKGIMTILAVLIVAGAVTWFVIGVGGDPSTSSIRKDADRVVHGLHKAGELSQKAITIVKEKQ